MAADNEFVYERDGYCIICSAPRRFYAKYDWYRDWLFCSDCGSVPRERALALVLERVEPNWRDKSIHESSPEPRGISLKLQENCPRYIATQYFPGYELGASVNSVRNENIEISTFDDRSFDLVITLDVMEHVNNPDKVIADVFRTLAPGGRYIFTVPTDKGRIETKRVALYLDDGNVEHYEAPEYHGNPVNDLSLIHI